MQGLGDVAKKIVRRVRDALQLPGSPIPAVIGVMAYEREGRYMTNTAEAVDRYMVIRLGRYAYEMGIRPEVEWARKQDLLAEVAFEMVQGGVESLSSEEFRTKFDAIFDRLGEARKSETTLRELVESGVLVQKSDGVGFHRTAFRDFFAAHFIFRGNTDFDQFFEERLFDREWGSVLVFAAGLRRQNTSLLGRLTALVSDLRNTASPTPEYLYGTYLLGRILSNSESADADRRVSALRTALRGSSDAIPAFAKELTDNLGRIGELVALMGIEQTFLVTVGVPWLEKQFSDLLFEEGLSDEERYLLVSVYANLGCSQCMSLLERAAKVVQSTRVLLVLRVLLLSLRAERSLSPAERATVGRIQRLVQKKLAKRRAEVKAQLEMKSRLLRLEVQKMRRIGSGKGS